MMRLLSIDGGGIRGVIPALVLAEIERRTRMHIWQMFDLIAGTSTGGILALGLTVPINGTGEARFRAKHLVDLYSDEGRMIFRRSWRSGLFSERYTSDGIESVLRKYFGDAMLSSALEDVVITAYDIERRMPWVFRRNGERDFRMADVARATSAAPTYFEPHRIECGNGDYLALVDGGVFANNPAMVALAEAETYDAMIVSLGTGQHCERIPYESACSWGLAGWAKPVLDIVFDGGSQAAHMALKRHLPHDRYWRFQPDLEPSMQPMDDASQGNIRNLRLVAARMIEDRSAEIDTICEALLA